MQIKNLSINCFRNIHSQSFELTPSFNIFYGQNGAGKTSLLEAIFYLGMGKSFRTHLTNRIVEHNSSQFLLSAAFTDDENQAHFLGLERHCDGERTIKLDRIAIPSIAPVARLMPLQLISVDSYRYFSDGPKERRAFLDWGVFHNYPDYLTLWQQYNRVLKQRNIALKMRLPKSEVSIWNNEYVILSEQIDTMRQDYINQFKRAYHEILLRILPTFDSADIRYKRGWTREKSLNELLDTHFTRDSAFGYTQDGPHRADFQLYIDSYPADDVFSQGQLKLAAYALHLAQGILLKQRTGKTPIYLIDDLPSELDCVKQQKVLEIIKELNAQVIITGITADSLQNLIDNSASQMFHVEQGQFTATVPTHTN